MGIIQLLNKRIGIAGERLLRLLEEKYGLSPGDIWELCGRRYVYLGMDLHGGPGYERVEPFFTPENLPKQPKIFYLRPSDLFPDPAFKEGNVKRGFNGRVEIDWINAYLLRDGIKAGRVDIPEWNRMIAELYPD